MSTALARIRYSIVCARCNTTLERGTPHAPTSHTICPRCEEVFNMDDKDIRTLHRFKRREYYAQDPHHLEGDKLNGLYVDTETTGLDTATDQIIELALLPFEFDHAGNVYNVGPGVDYFNDPGKPIPPEITELTGITDEMVEGQSIDVPKVNALVLDSSLIIAHHADFDRKMMERSFPVTKRANWACSYREVDWRGMFKAPCSKLEHLLMETCDGFYEPHRALDDCEVGLHILATALHDARPALSYLLESARQKTSRIWAVNSPFQRKDILKARGYSWSANVKTWYRDVRAADVAEEKMWLGAAGGCNSPRVVEFDAKDRYSVRAE